MTLIRLDKYLADAGAGTRTQIKSMVRAGAVKVDGEVARDPGRKVEASDAEVLLFDQPVRRPGLTYILMNKPAGVISSTEEDHDTTVVDLLPPDLRRGLYPVGRLDRDTEGLLLLTNDGKLTHQLLSPKKHVAKVYYARVDGPLDERQVELFASGLDIGDYKPALPAGLAILESSEESACAHVTLTEGRYHEVKRLFGAVGRKVVYLKRISMGNLRLPDDLPTGSWRFLTEEEMKSLTCVDNK